MLHGAGRFVKETRYTITGADLSHLLWNIQQDCPWDMKVSILPHVALTGKLTCFIEFYDPDDEPLTSCYGGTFGQVYPHSDYLTMEAWLQACVYEAESDAMRHRQLTATAKRKH